MAAIVPSENQEHRALVKWLSYHPILRDYYFHITNEGQRTAKQGFNLQLMGLRRGVSDLFIYYPVLGFNGLFLEVKRNKSYSSSEMRSETWVHQQHFLEVVKKVGYAGKICYGWEDGKNIIEGYLLSSQ